MADFDDTFNMFIGITDKDFNWYDNPYISANVYEVDENFQTTISSNLKLSKCEEKDMEFVANRTVGAYYPNSVCFSDKGSLKL